MAIVQCRTPDAAKRVVRALGSGEVEERDGRFYVVYGPPSLQEKTAAFIWRLDRVCKAVAAYSNNRRAA